MKTTYIIIVFYNPTINQINTVVELARFHNVIVVDNSNAESIKNPKFEYIPLYENKGIASAQNIGIRRALALGADYLLFYDQDSNLELNYPILILDEYIKIKKEDPTIAMLGPCIIDERSGRNNKTNENLQNYKKVNAIINSGMITEITIVEQNGYFDESLFIDYVDFEWSWRAGYNGFSCYITPNLTLKHSIGNKYYNIGGFVMYISAPIRYYYQYRNFLFLFRRKYVPIDWKLKGLIRKTLDLFILPFLVRETKQTIKYILKGILHGFVKSNSLKV